jgi:hypothetical protein
MHAADRGQQVRCDGNEQRIPRKIAAADPINLRCPHREGRRGDWFRSDRSVAARQW